MPNLGPILSPITKEAKILPKFRFRVSIDQAESQWVKLDAECIDTVSVGMVSGANSQRIAPVDRSDSGQ